MSKTCRLASAVSAVVLLAVSACSTNIAGSEAGERPTGTMNVGTGVDVDLDRCSSTWNDTVGITDKQIKIGMSVPRSGPLADVGGLADGVRTHFKRVNAENPIDGKEVVFDVRDDAYNPARTKTNVQDMIAANDVFGFLYVVGTANNAAVQPLIEEACTPHVLAGTGQLDLTAKPANHPWIQGGLLSYRSEASLWCSDIERRYGTGKSVAYLAMDNDFGDDYARGIEACEKRGVVKVAEAQRHAPTAPSITNQLTTMAASKADIVLLATTSAFCPQALSGIEASSWEPATYLSATCNRVNATFAPIAPAGGGTLVALSLKDSADPQYDDDSAVQKAAKQLKAAGVASTGRPMDGMLMGEYLEYALRTAAEMEGGLTRTNLLKVMWKSDLTPDLAVEGITLKTDGEADPLIYDSARIGEYQPPTSGQKVGTFRVTGDVLSVSGD